MKTLIKRIQRMVRREMLPEDIGEEIITKITANAKTHYCGNCALIEQKDIDGRSVSWCPANHVRVSGFDVAPKCWVSQQDLDGMMDEMARQAEEEFEGAYVMQSDAADHYIDERNKVVK